MRLLLLAVVVVMKKRLRLNLLNVEAFLRGGEKSR
jgi:hypothetical protein